MKYWFPAAHAVNSFAITGLLVALALAGDAGLAADVGMIHAVLMLTFQALSGDVRSITLQRRSRFSLTFLLSSRVVFLLPLAVVAWLLSVSVSADGGLALFLICRRASEWIAEVHLSSREIDTDQRTAGIYTTIQAAAFGGVVLTGVSPAGSLGTGAFVLWATSPLFLCGDFLCRNFNIRAGLSRDCLAAFLPYLRSTSINAGAVFAFRSLVLMLGGRVLAGELFAAFSLGSLIATLFARAIGPSMLYEKRHLPQRTPRLVWLLSLGTVAVGSLLLIAQHRTSFPWGFRGRSDLFWQAVGLSMVGGAFMLHGILNRLRLLQQSGGSVLGQDTLFSMLIVLSVPFLYLARGPQALAFCFLWNGILSVLFYGGGYHLVRLRDESRPVTGYVVMAILAGLSTPVFFQLSSGIFRSTTQHFESGGSLSRLPLPFSVAACYAGIAMLADYRKCRLSLNFLFWTAIILVAVCLFSTPGAGDLPSDRLMLVIQYLLPMPALLLGQTYGARWGHSGRFERVLFWMLAFVIPLQVARTFLDGYYVLRPSVFLFSIYQHLQYVPLVMIVLFLLVFFRLYDTPTYRRGLFLLSPVVGIYAAMSSSFMTLGSLLIGLTVFVIHRWLQDRPMRSACLVAAMTILTMVCHVHAGLNNSTNYMVGKLTQFRPDARSVNQSSADLVPVNVADRFTVWKFYSTAVAASPGHLWLGHAHPPARAEYPSAHNYLLDSLYNFGLVGTLPVAVLMALTLIRVLPRSWQVLKDPQTCGWALAVLLLVFADNMFKVGLRQPYPGILAFFLWGSTLSMLQPQRASASSSDITPTIPGFPPADDVPGSPSKSHHRRVA